MHALRRVDRDSFPPEDDEIQALARLDRRRAVDLITRKYRQRLYHHALYIVKDREEAYDVVQEVFIKAIREPRFFQTGFKMKAWLFRVTTNLCFNIVRNKRRRGTILESVPMADRADADQLEQVFEEQRQQAILASMERLSEDHRRILMLRYYSDLSYAEIADTLDIALGTVMSRLSRARARLTRLLDVDGLLEPTR